MLSNKALVYKVDMVRQGLHGVTWNSLIKLAFKYILCIIRSQKMVLGTNVVCHTVTLRAITCSLVELVFVGLSLVIIEPQKEH